MQAEMKKPRSGQASGLLESNVNLSRKNVMKNNSTAVTIDNLSVVCHAGKPVVSTALLAKLYGTDPKRIQNNYLRNADRFESGKHFFKVIGEELANLRPSLGGLHASTKARALILWTERGAARHAKMLETDEAWNVFERLEDCYFDKVAVVADAPPAIPVEPQLSPDRQRWLLSFDHQGNQQVTPIAPNAFVLSHREYLDGLFVHGDIMLSTEEMFDIAIAALSRLKARHEIEKARRAKA